MPFLSLHPINFRNLNNESIDLSSKEIYFVGENGQGKSNLLEALYYAAYGNSFRTNIESEIIKKNENSMKVNTLFKDENGYSHTTSIFYDSKIKKMEKDGKFIKDRKDLINTMPCVLFNHDDLDFAVGAPERRRFFIDQSLTMYDVMYVDVLRKYKRVLKNRNLCLKEKKYDLIDTYNIQLVQNGLEIQEKRKKSIFVFNQIFGKMYYDVCGIEGVSIKYNPSWKINNDEDKFSQVMNILNEKSEVEKIMQTTMTGPHRDRIIFLKDNEPFVPVASTGQRRLLALVLRSAQAVYYKQVTGKNPILLMDDVLLELDPEKRKKITMLLPEYDQLFCTFLPGEPYEKYKKETTMIYEIKNGSWSKVNE